MEDWAFHVRQDHLGIELGQMQKQNTKGFEQIFRAVAVIKTVTVIRLLSLPFLK